MYSREESSKIKQEFWTTFGKYISPQKSTEGLKINWINYKTGVKHVFIKLEADKNEASICFQIAHPDTEIQELFFSQFEAYKTLLHDALNEEWEWRPFVYTKEGKVHSQIIKTLCPVNILNKNDWPSLISFFKPRIIALDEFWSTAKYGFESLNY
ncbi:MAG: hypothetical protein JWN56_3081 [Sphingobacteriales bacterium]|nr:hypothetical protein [Sphingobacteriales bacterium]